MITTQYINEVMTMRCPGCGAEYDAPHRYCGKCGQMLVPGETGSHRWPLIILTTLVLLGLLAWFALPRVHTEPVQYSPPAFQEQSV